MNGVDANLLKQLAPAHALSPPGWWPPAPGWWLLLALVLLAALALGLWLRRPRRRVRRLALRELQQLERAGADDAVLAGSVQNLLRRYAVVRFGPEPVARLSGERWIAFLAENGGTALAGAPGSDLLRTAYGGVGSGSRAQWLSAARNFLKAN
ncbi:MAG: DUF4381 domain-containing protein [Stenotrophobium sp.]